ncbi:hypothetical protein D3093_32980 (plasmid) [Azospirillum argentinense]|uniref:Uncharacterized protein n=1 Tax=Azospirillum argentinense TaxID=2970906 RepID=A0A4D8PTD3_9PROT|nr:hypothetical protein [Azospirillum argentinense]QCO00078.1 hypothetical protein D3093_32980 [Azospirillum argentinense]
MRSLRAEKDRRREKAKERRREIFGRILAALEALQAAGVPGRLVLPLKDDQPIHLLVDATAMPTQALAARLVRRSMGDAFHTIHFAGDLAPDALESIMGASLPLEALRRHRPN